MSEVPLYGWSVLSMGGECWPWVECVVHGWSVLVMGGVCWPWVECVGVGLCLHRQLRSWERERLGGLRATSKRRGNTSKWVRGFYLNAEGRIWP